MRCAMCLMATVALVTVSAGAALSYDDTQGFVDDVRWYARGTVGYGYVKIDRQVTNTEGAVICTRPFVWIDGAKPGHEHLIRLGTAALLSGKPVRVRVSGCHVGYPVLQAIILQR